MRIGPYTKRLAPIAMLSCLSAAALSPVRASESPYLFGDWNGSRSQLADEGVTFDVGYANEAAHNLTGGTRRITRVADQWKFGASFDLDRLW